VIAYAQFSENYRLRIEWIFKDEYVIAVEGPLPISQHRQMILDLEAAKETAFYLARWHFRKQKITEDFVPLERIEWTVAADT
jgi:hypothetical protein